MCNRRLQLDQPFLQGRAAVSFNPDSLDEDEVFGLDEIERIKKHDPARKKLLSEPTIELDTDGFDMKDEEGDNDPFPERQELLESRTLKIVQTGNGGFTSFASCSGDTLLLSKSKHNESAPTTIQYHPTPPKFEGMGRRHIARF
jgi:hypothetical protein